MRRLYCHRLPEGECWNVGRRDASTRMGAVQLCNVEGAQGFFRGKTGCSNVLDRWSCVVFEAVRQQTTHRLLQISSRHMRWFQFRSIHRSRSSPWVCARAYEKCNRPASVCFHGDRNGVSTQWCRLESLFQFLNVQLLLRVRTCENLQPPPIPPIVCFCFP